MRPGGLQAHPRRGRVIGQAHRGLLQRASGKVGAKRPGLNAGHAHPQGLELGGQSIAPALDRMLGGSVITRARKAHQTGDRAYAQDAATAPLAHARHHRAGDIENAEDIGLKDCPDLRILSLFHRRLVAVASVIHQHINAPKTLLGLLYRRTALLGIAHIQGQGQAALPAGL